MSASFMRRGAHQDRNPWKSQTYPVPVPGRRAFRWKAAVLRIVDRWNPAAVFAHPATVMVPALYNAWPAESVASGWLNEIDAQLTIRQRMACAARITGWDVFTFHTLHNADRFFDTTIAAMRDTWVKEGTLSTAAIRETRRLFPKPYDYYRVHARLVENLVFQSSLLDWILVRASDVQLRLHVVGTALLSALVSTGSVSFMAAVESAVKFGSKWDQTLRDMAGARTNGIERAGFERIRRLLEGRASFSLGVSRSELPSTDAPAQPFWYSPVAAAEPTLITTAQEAANALETLDLASWSSASRRATANAAEPVRGWLVSPLHPMARICRWSFANHLLATPSRVTLFLDHIAALSRKSALQTAEPFQNRLRLSRMRVTGP